MQHPYDVLKSEYATLLANVHVLRASAVDTVAHKLVGLKNRYAPVSANTGVPIVWLACTFERESSSNFRLYFGNGDSLLHRTVHVPKGRGPFIAPDGQPDWTAGTIDALGVDHIADVKDWSWERACYEWELWNGFGPRNHGKHSGYLWAGTTAYTGGKYVADGVWNPSAQDAQLGTMPIALRMAEIDPSLEFDKLPILSSGDAAPPLQPQPTPSGVGGGQDVQWVQSTLNRIQDAGLDVDGSYGRNTKRAVIAFQTAHGLEPDGLIGPLTVAALQSAVAG